MNLKVWMFVNVDWFFASHRLPVAQEAEKRGVSMTVFADRSERKPKFNEHGFVFRQSPIRRKAGAFSMVMDFFRAAKSIRAGRPEILHAVTVKPIIIVGILARFYNIPFIASISGLGPAFSLGGFFKNIRTTLVIFIYRFIFRNKRSVAVVQTDHDRDVMLKSLICVSSQLHKFNGSGVKIADFSRMSPDLEDENLFGVSESKTKVLMASRLLADKGIVEFLDVAGLLSTELSDVEWLLAGPFDDDSPTGLEKRFVLKKCSDAGVRYLGNVEDMPTLLRSVDIFVYPSYYPEGLPKILLEVSAAGVPIVTTDHPGCRDAIVNGSSGLLTKPRDVTDLRQGVLRLINDPKTREAMGRFSSAYAQENYDVSKIVERHFALYHSLLTSS